MRRILVRSLWGVLAALVGLLICLGFADALVIQLQRLFGRDPIATIARLEITAGQRELLLDSYHGKGSG